MDRNEVEQAFKAVEREKCRRDFSYWLHAYCLTKDPKDLENPVKLFPRLPYIAPLIDELTKVKTMRIAKSRQLMVSWLFSAYALWYSQFHAHRLVLLLSMTEDDANALIERIRFMYDNQPAWLKELCPIEKPWRDQAMSMCRWANGSEIMSIPAGPHKIRGKTPSLVISDEAAFQERWEETHTAVLPAISGGGKLVIVSTALAGFFETQVREDQERPDDLGKEVVKGLFKRYTKSGVPIFNLFYWADPHKQQGSKWEEDEAASYPGGRNGPAWRREMNIDFGAGIGEMVFPTYQEDAKKILFQPHELDASGFFNNCTFFGGFDWGMRNNTAFVVIAQDQFDRFWQVWEWGGKRANAYEVAEAVLSCPYYGRLRWIAADPSMWNKNQHSSTRNGQFTSHADIFLNELPEKLRITKLMKAHEKNDLRFVASLQLRWMLPQPTFRIAQYCTRTNTEFKNLKYAQGQVTANQPEKIVDKDNHFFDACKYALMSNPQYVKPVEKPKYNTMGHLMDCEELARQLANKTGCSFEDAFASIYEAGEQ